MKRLLLLYLTFVFAWLIVPAQNPADSPKNSPWIYAYKINDEAIREIIMNYRKRLDTTHLTVKTDSIPFTAEPDTLKQWYKTLKPGYYAIVWVQNSQFKIEHQHISDLNFWTLAGKEETLLFVNAPGNTTRVWLKDQPLPYYEEYGAFVLKGRKQKGLLTIQTTKETGFYNFSKKTYGRFSELFTFSHKQQNHQEARYPRQPRYSGYLVTHQPKYRQGDTVKLKAFIVHRSGKPVQGEIILKLRHPDYRRDKIATLGPTTTGAYVFEYPIPDSLTLDKEYTWELEYKKRTLNLNGGNFYYEDYLLDNVTYELRVEKTSYEWNDSITFKATAKDANGRPAPDARMEFRMALKRIISLDSVDSDREHLYIPTRLADTTLYFDTNGELSYTLPDTLTPDIHTAWEVAGRFLNSENEAQDTTFSLSIIPPDKSENEEDSVTVPVMADVSLSGRRTRDSVIVDILNPRGLTIRYRWWKGKKLVEEHLIETDHHLALKDKSDESYRMDIVYIWERQERKDQIILPVFDKALTITIQQPGEVVPGDTSEVLISVKDYEGKPVSGVNLTALAVSEQFRTDPVPEVPYLGEMPKLGNQNSRLSYKDEIRINNPKLTSDWLKPMALDTAIIFRLTYPDSVFSYYHPIEHHLPQFSPYLYEDGVQSKILMIWVDGKLRYFAGTHTQTPYAFPVKPGLHTIRLRTRNALYVIPAIRTKTGYKLEISVNPANLPSGVKKYPRTSEMTFSEIMDLNNSLIRISWAGEQYDQTYVWQDYQAFELQPGRRVAIAGPFDMQRLVKVKMLIPGKSEERVFIARPGDHFILSEDQLVIENGEVFGPKSTFRDYYQRQEIGSLALLPGDITRDSLPEKWKRHHFSEGLSTPPFGTLRIGFPSEQIPDYGYLMRQNDPHNVWPVYFSSQEDMELYPGVYRLILQKGKDTFHTIEEIQVKENQLLYLLPNELSYQRDTFLMRNLGVESTFSPDGYFQDEIHHFGPYDLQGQLTDTLTGAPITHAKMVLNLYGERFMVTETDSLGQFLFSNIQDGDYTILGLKRGYRLKMNPVFIRGHDSIRIALFPLGAKRLDSVGVVVYDRHIFTKAHFSNDSLITKGNRYFTMAQMTAGVVQSGIYEDFFDMRGARSLPSKYYIDGVKIRGNTPISGYSVESRGNSEKAQIIKGQVTNEHGEPVIGATVMIMGKPIGAYTDNDGKFRLNVPIGSHTIITRYIGYESTNVPIYIYPGQVATLNLTIKQSIAQLDEVVVTALGVSSKRFSSLSKNMKKIEPSKHNLGYVNDPSRLVMSYHGVQAEVFGLSSSSIDLNALRSEFSDNAAWEPNLITDANGEARFTLVFPDNVTTWTTHVLAMNDNRQTGYARTSSQASKPVLARLGVPQFALLGDTLNLTGRVVSYESDSLSIRTSFYQEEELLSSRDTILKTFRVDHANAIADADTLNLSYLVQVEGGYTDGEKRQVPVFPVGMEEKSGTFYYLEGDTTIHIDLQADKGPATLRIFQHPHDMLMEDLRWLKSYPHDCNEQIASKLIAFTLEKQGLEAAGQEFRYEPMRQRLIRKLKRNRHEDGSWGWWEEGEGHVWMTAWITRALQMADVEPSWLNLSVNWLERQLYFLSSEEQLRVLEVLATAVPDSRYPALIGQLEKEAGKNTYQTLRIARIRQLWGDQPDVAKIIKTSQTDLLGGRFWGKQQWCWYGGDVEMTLLAFEILRDAKHSPATLAEIRNYLLRRQNKNTIETASVLATILPDLSDTGVYAKDTTSRVSVSHSGQQLIQSFPYTMTISDGLNQPLSLQKSGIQPVFTSVTYQYWNPKPALTDSLFAIHTRLMEKNIVTDHLTAGKAVVLQVKVSVKKEGKYLMLQVPIPAGCTYEEKSQNFSRAVHAEYQKDRVKIFFKHLPEGEYSFDISLQPRYSGHYSLNPAQMEMMYVPARNGNNEVKKVRVNPSSSSRMEP